MSRKLKALVLPPAARLDMVCSAACRRLLEQECDPVWNETGADYTPEQLAPLLADAELIVTSWGSPLLTEELLREAPRLRYIAHAAGTLKRRVPDNVLESGRVRLFSAAPRIARSVGEYCLAALLHLLWRFPQMDAQVRSGLWKNGALGRELRGQTVGIVSASSTARAFIDLLQPFGVHIRVYDPFLSPVAAEQLGVVSVSLEDVMQCPIISVHAPSLPETKGLLTAELLRLIPDGAIFINSSRGAVLDEAALTAELATGRFVAALDVLQQEPPQPDHPLFGLGHVLLTPHIAGMTVEGCLSLMEEVLQDVLRAERGETTRYEIKAQAWAVMA